MLLIAGFSDQIDGDIHRAGSFTNFFTNAVYLVDSRQNWHDLSLQFATCDVDLS
jgi:hypothetical protein